MFQITRFQWLGGLAVFHFSSGIQSCRFQHWLGGREHVLLSFEALVSGQILGCPVWLGIEMDVFHPGVGFCFEGQKIFVRCELGGGIVS